MICFSYQQERFGLSDLPHSSFVCLFSFFTAVICLFEIGSLYISLAGLELYVDQAGLELMAISPPQPP